MGTNMIYPILRPLHVHSFPYRSVRTVGRVVEGRSAPYTPIRPEQERALPTQV